jgi:hypothetical protein
MPRTLDDFLEARTVRATRRIQDSPLAREDSGAKRGEIGVVEEVIKSDGLIAVDFGRGAVLCEVDEISLASSLLTSIRTRSHLTAKGFEHASLVVAEE